MKIGSLHILPIITGLFSLILTASCGNDTDKGMAGNVDPETVATMTTRDVETLISDSGVTRYKIITPIWLVYDEAKEPKWRFPEGLHLERFDNFFNEEATVDCDSAIYFKDKQLWQLDGHVRVRNMIGEKFLTQQLFWDQKHEEVYSDSFIRVERTDRIMEGYGFTSNSQMTRFKVKNVSAILPMDEFRNRSENKDSLDEETVLETDTISDLISEV